MNLTIGADTLDRIIRHMQSAYPREGCGLVVGSGPEVRFIPVTNISDASTAYEMDPQELINALREIRATNETLQAIAHSHPHGPATPSKADIARAYYPEAAHLIVSLADPKRPQVAAFRIFDGEVLEVELRAIV